jgi:hypothetical protein
MTGTERTTAERRKGRQDDGRREGKQRRIARGANKERREGRMKGKARGGDAGRMDGRTSRQGRKGGRTRTKRATAERREGR